jgi:hypothetical protein
VFVIVWKGKGYVAALAAVVALIAATIVSEQAKLPALWSSLTYTAAMSAAGVALWFYTRKIEDRPPRILIDKATRQEITVRRSAGSFFFIPTRYWPYILPGLAVAGSIFTAFNPTLH